MAPVHLLCLAALSLEPQLPLPRGGVPSITAPPAAALLAPEPTTATHNNTLTDFGYYYEGCDAGTVCALPAANHSTTTFASPGSFRSGAATLQAANISAVVTCEGLFVNQSSAGATLWPDWQNRWDMYWASIAPHSASILAFYPVDEPSPTLIASGVYGTIVRAIKHSAPHIPIAAVVTASAVKGIEFSAYSLPPEVDWVGYDNCKS
jgi:hypothetical protein